MLRKELGKQFGKAGSWSEGIEVERRFLIDSVGVDSTQFSLSDGSGPQAWNFVSHSRLRSCCLFMRSTRTSRHSSPASRRPAIPDRSSAGSSQHRSKGRSGPRPASISGVNTLSGYFELNNGKTFTFSVQANHHVLGGRTMLPEIDTVVVALAKAVSREE
jgi:hypothetical protein